ncbi:MAG: AMP-binding protein, partial [bacterium]|nr:AMP-binding protein [bacterium]
MLKQSYVHGSSTKSLIGQTIGNNLDAAVEQWADHEALVVCHQNIRWSYSELQAEVNRFAAGLISLGLNAGDRIGIWSPNNAEWVVAQLATAKAGLILVNINPAYRVFELEYVLNKVEARALILASQFKSSDYFAMVRELAPEIEQCDRGKLRSERLPQLEIVIQTGVDTASGMYAFADVAELADDDSTSRLEALSSQLQFDDPINIQFTSGTTGFPKGATLTHFNILNNGYFVGEAMKLSSQDRLCIPVPLYHCFGMVLGNLACLTHGATIVLPGEAFEPLSVLNVVQQESCTGLHGVP